MRRMSLIAPFVFCLVLVAGHGLVAADGSGAGQPLAISPVQSAAPSVTLEPVEAEQALLATGEVAAQATDCIYCISATTCTYLGEPCNKVQRCRCQYCNGFLGCTM